MSALYAWLRRHPRLVDGVLAAVLAIGGVGNALTHHRPLLIPITLGLTVPVIFRRGHPTQAFATAVGFGAIQVFTHTRPSPSDLAIVVLLYTLAAYTTRRESMLGLLICLVGCAVAVLTWVPYARLVSEPDRLLIGSIMFAGPSLIAWVLGDSMRYRRAYYANLEERAARLERDRDAQAQIAAAAERARIARELHDVVAHNVSVMVVQADGAAYALSTNPKRAREALAAISATGRQALTEMRVLLGVLRKTDGADQPGLAPVPGLDQLDELIEQTRAAGLEVSCSVEGNFQPLPGGTALAAYRIIQESLTNVRKHAGPWARASVLLRHTADALELSVTDDGIGDAAVSDGAGHGLTGMYERAAMYGGFVRAGALPGGGFAVQARLPLALAQISAAQAGAPTQASTAQAGAATQASAPTQASTAQAGTAQPHPATQAGAA